MSARGHGCRARGCLALWRGRWRRWPRRRLAWWCLACWCDPAGGCRLNGRYGGRGRGPAGRSRGQGPRPILSRARSGSAGRGRLGGNRGDRRCTGAAGGSPAAGAGAGVRTAPAATGTGAGMDAPGAGETVPGRGGGGVAADVATSTPPSMAVGGTRTVAMVPACLAASSTSIPWRAARHPATRRPKPSNAVLGDRGSVRTLLAAAISSPVMSERESWT